MRILRQLPDHGQNIHGGASISGGAITVGNYDGLHVGHQSLFKKMQEFSGPKTVITFDPHPLQVLQPQRGLKLVFPRADLAEQLPSHGIDNLVLLPFDLTFAALTAREFLDRYIAESLKPSHFIAGYDFAFGSGREGTLEVLKTWAAGRGIAVDVVPPLRLGGEIVSSRRIRDLVMKGDVHGASLLLGRPFYMRGEVVQGAGRGARIGVPTLNQKVINETLPANGVYASRVRFGGKVYPSVTNVGTNPTFEGGLLVKVETHVLDTVADWRGETVDVDLIERLREEKKFSDVEDLKKQIQNDILKAKGILGA